MNVNTWRSLWCNLSAAHHHIYSIVPHRIKFKYNKHVLCVYINATLICTTVLFIPKSVEKGEAQPHWSTTTLLGTTVSRWRRCWVCDPALSLCDPQDTCWLIWFYLESHLLVSNGTQNNKQYYKRIFLYMNWT